MTPELGHLSQGFRKPSPLPQTFPSRNGALHFQCRLRVDGRDALEASETTE